MSLWFKIATNVGIFLALLAFVTSVIAYQIAVTTDQAPYGVCVMADADYVQLVRPPQVKDGVISCSVGEYWSVVPVPYEGN